MARKTDPRLDCRVKTFDNATQVLSAVSVIIEVATGANKGDLANFCTPSFSNRSLQLFGVHICPLNPHKQRSTLLLTSIPLSYKLLAWRPLYQINVNLASSYTVDTKSLLTTQTTPMPFFTTTNLWAPVIPSSAYFPARAVLSRIEPGTLARFDMMKSGIAW